MDVHGVHDRVLGSDVSVSGITYQITLNKKKNKTLLLFFFIIIASVALYNFRKAILHGF